MITERDRIILKHIDEFGYITLSQTVLIAYNTIGCGYDYARRRMNTLKKQGSIKCHRSAILNCNIYYFDDSKKNPSLHRHLSMEYYCKLISLGAKIEYFNREEIWADKTEYRCISDIVCSYIIGDTRFYNLVEINVSNNKLKLERFDKIIPYFKNKFLTNCIPNMILIDDTIHKEYNTKLNVIRVNYDMSNISEIFI